MYYDYIIIGSGIAGLNSALNAAEKGNVLVITKKKMGNCNTWYAQGGIASVFGKKDSFQKHVHDTLKAGHYYNNKKTVEHIVKNGPAAIQKFLKLGVPFSKNRSGSIALSLEGGHQEKRIIHVRDFTGKAIEETFIKKVKKHHNIKILQNTFAADLLVKKNICYGVQTIQKGHFKNYYGRIVILASGGVGQVYQKTTNPRIATGDGIAMAYRAGCKIQDLEFIQFHPTALLENKSPLFLLSEALRGEGAILINKQEKRFMVSKHPAGELAPRDVISQEIFEQQKKGGIFLDLRHLNQKILKKKYPQIMAKLDSMGINPAQQAVPITPAAHYSCGGIVTNLKGATSVKNLYAHGEVTCTGLHGANRLASNSLLEAAVMSEQIKKIPLPPLNKIINFPLPSYKKKASTRKLQLQIKKIMWKNVGIIRTREGLEQAFKKLRVLRKKSPKSTDIQSFETNNLLTVGLLITKAALQRKKSLGSHFIQDNS